MPKLEVPAKPAVELLLEALRALDAARDALLDMNDDHADELETVYGDLAVAAGQLLVTEALPVA
jgi:hypothetical protein